VLVEILIRPTPAHVARLVARIVSDRVRAKPELVLGCATGRTMEAVYDEIVAVHDAGHVDLARVRTFNLDEYVGLSPEDPRSYHRYMRERLFDRVGLTLERTRLPNGVAPDLAAEARAYERAIADAGGIDLQLLGLGATGHIGFNEPLSALMSRTREKALTPTTRAQNAEMFGGDPASVPARALTMGVGTILEAREVLLVATGAAKAAILARATEGPITARISATALQLHPSCKVIVDEDAASALEGSAYYRFSYDNEPEWAPYRSDPAL
jgi:glucosamine-6-phosphate deaminase